MLTRLCQIVWGGVMGAFFLLKAPISPGKYGNNECADMGAKWMILVFVLSEGVCGLDAG